MSIEVLGFRREDGSIAAVTIKLRQGAAKGMNMSLSIAEAKQLLADLPAAIELAENAVGASDGKVS